MKIIELKGRAQVFTLKNGKTFRILAREVKEVADSNISNEMHIAKNMGLILMTKSDSEVPTNKKSGGTK